MSIPRRTRQQAQAQLEREEQDIALLRDYSRQMARLRRDSVARILDITDAEWQALMDADAEWEKRDTFVFEIAEVQPWEPIVAQGSPVMRHVHFVSMRDDVAEQTTRGELTNIRAKAYEKELKLQGQAVGCPEYQARLGQSEEWVTMLEHSTNDARGITTTYNRELANQINKIRRDVPTANRHVYAKRIGTWEKNRSAWKDKQTQQFAANDARGRAQADFYNKNGIVEGYAILRPRTAVCPICRGWVARGKVSVNIAMAEPGLWHPNCVHLWDITTPKLPPDGCKNLWKPGGGPRVPSMPTPVEPVARQAPPATPEETVQAIKSDIVQQAGISDDAMEMYWDAMSLDEENFIKYANKLGVSDPEALAREYFAVQRQASRNQLRARIIAQDTQTLKTSQGYVVHHQDIGEELIDIAQKGRVGNSVKDVEDVLQQRYGVTVRNELGLADDLVHTELSELVNVAEHNADVGSALRDNCKVIRYGEHRGIGDTASMSFESERGGTIARFPGRKVNSSSWVHELGHGVEERLESGVLRETFGKGTRASSYAWTNAEEDFAETFVATVSGRTTGIGTSKLEAISRVMGG